MRVARELERAVALLGPLEGRFPLAGVTHVVGTAGRA
jgi:hypothetical protein